ncbi:MAG: alkaline phosphatase family protein [Asgard group archaeon]|nr:alkaline phosphatase family protein [Asgard group archaeon]
MSITDLPLQPFRKRQDLFYPDLERNIAKVTPSMLSLLTDKFSEERTLQKYLAKKDAWKELQHSSIENVVMIILDAVGYEQFMHSTKLFSQNFSSHGLVLSSVFPSITSACLVSLYHGRMPAEHGIVGHKIMIPQIGNIVDTLKMNTISNWKTTLPEVGVNVRQWLWTDFPLAGEEETIERVQLIENHIANTGLSYLTNRKRSAIGYSSHVDCFSAAKRILETKTTDKKVLDIYVGSTDHIAHRYTPESPALTNELRNIEHLFFSWLDDLDPSILEKTAIMFTADHGQETLDNNKTIAISREEEEELRELITYRGGSGRVIHLYAKEGKIDELFEWWDERLGSQGEIVTVLDYPSLMGDKAASQQVRNRLGDMQIVLGEGTALYFRHTGYFDEVYNLGLNATHGSLSKNELLVPLFFGRADTLRNF